MRVTTQGTFAQVNYNLQRAYKRFGTAQQVVTTGLRINQLSDDPSGAVRALGLQSFSSSISQYQKNIDTLQPYLQQTDSTLSQIEQDLTSARTIAVASANDTQSATDRATAATQVAGLLSDALAAANTKFGNGYIFAGFANGTAPYSESGGVVTYNGDSGVLQIQASSASSIALNIPGNQVFQGVGVTGGIDIFDTLSKLETALKNNNVNGTDGVETQLTNLDGGIDQILSFRAQVGSRVNLAQGASDALSALSIQTQTQLSSIQDADTLKSYSDFTRYQQALQAALSSAAQVIQPTLLNFLAPA